MYVYDEIDQRLVDERVAQFREQTRRFLAGKLGEEEFKALRLRNGLYIQKFAPMLRIAIPYGMLSSRQLRKLAHIARRYDRGYGHFSTRQNLQLNWPKLEEVPEILAELATVQMHAIQTSGNSFRNVTTDHFAGVGPDGEVGFRVLVGGGLGRTPLIGHVIREFLPWRHLLTYLEAIVRVYNLHGRRDNLNRARIKILVHERGPERFREEVEAEWAQLKDGPSTLILEELERVALRFTRPRYEKAAKVELPKAGPFAAWMKRNVFAHKVPGYAAVTLSLKKTGVPPGDVTAEQMEAIAAPAERYSFGELRVTHEQNLVFADVRRCDLPALWGELRALGLATPNVGLLTHIICCPGGDFCSLANAKSIPVAEAIQRRFDDLDYLHDIGELDLNISGCMNACGHHHVGHIGILGVDKQGAEYYQISIGGVQGNDAALGKVLGPSVSQAEVPDVIEKLIDLYLARRDSEEERFVDVVRRIGIEPFKEHVYGNHYQESADHSRQLATA